MRTYLRSKVTLLFMTCAVILLVFPAMASAQGAPTIQSDKEDYAPGSTVTLTGSGWQANETVHINVNDELGKTWSRDVDVTADANGNITDQFQLPSTFVAVYNVTATGAQSGVVTTSFTDANMIITGDSSAVAGNTKSYSAAADGGNCAQNLLYTWSVNNGASIQSGQGTSSVSIKFNNSGATTISVILTGDKTNGGACTSVDGNKSVAVSAAPTDSTKPVITPNIVGTLGNNGWYTSNVNLTWSVVDNESAISSQSGCGASSVTSDTNGTTFTCTATSAGGTDSKSVTIKRDATAPTINGTRSPAANANGWNNSDVTVSYTCSDSSTPGSGLASGACPASDTVSSEGANQSVTGNVTDQAGNTASVTKGDINIDKTDPTITASRTPAANGNGWNNSDVTVSYTCADSLSGVGSCSANDTVSSEGANQSSTGNVTDKAGNTASVTKGDINIDKTDPNVDVTGVSNGATYTLGSVPAAGCSTSDALSGVNANATLQPLSGGPLGSVTATCSGASDKAGNSGSASVTYNVHYNWTGFFRPVDNPEVLNSVKAGQSIPVKFSLAGNQGLNIFAAGSPTSQKITCDSSDPIDLIEETVTAGGSSLSYDASNNQYNYVWKSDKAWAGSCRQLSVKLIDGTTHVANFKFLK